MLPTMAADVTQERLENADAEPQNWLLPFQNYSSQRYSRLDQINRDNAKDLKVVPLNAPPPEPPAAKPAPASKPVTLAKAEPKPAPKPRPAPVEGPTVDFAPSLIDAAGAFGGYVARAGAIDGKFPNGAAIGKAVATSSAYETHQFQEGMVAYAALVALQEPGFVQAVWDLGRDARDRRPQPPRQMARRPVVGAPGRRARVHYGQL